MEIEMKKYTGASTILVAPMSKKDAEAHLKREIKLPPSVADEDAEGYLVKFKDGYEIWSPKGELEKSLKLADELQVEFDGLCEKFKGLVNFMYSDDSKNLSGDDRNCHDRRMKCMKDYLDITELCLYNANEEVYVRADQKRKAEARAKEAARK